jgi:tetratricopeptide (TPR) repeat protein
VLSNVREAIRARERLWVRSYLGLVALLFIGFAVPAVRTRVLYTIQRAIDAWDDRWVGRLEVGERMVADSQFVQAQPYLAALDAEFPARSNRHKWDKERERLLLALGKAYAANGHHRLALETYRRLVAFDPHNYKNNYALAMLANELRPSWAMPKEAHAQLLEAFKLNPLDASVLRELAQYGFEKAEWQETSALFEQYLNSVWFQHVVVKIGSDSTSIVVPVDGTFHDFEVSLPAPAQPSNALSLETRGLSAEVAQVTLVPALKVGAPGSPMLPIWPGGAVWQADSMKARGPGLFEARGGHTRLQLPLAPVDEPIGIVRLRLRLFKPVDAGTWDTIDRSYRNKLNYAGLAAAKARVLLPEGS